MSQPSVEILSRSDGKTTVAFAFVDWLPHQSQY
uniref:Uncharacterized protein n=1 Tax=Musa acuminata subsp. malaccensis TaxID=214687 RepID=A0A804I9H9_MUSAM